MRKRKALKSFGGWAFVIGIIGALVLGLLAGLGMFEAGVTLTTVLVVAGLVIGFMNINASEAVPMMLAGLVIGGGAGILSTLPLMGAVVVAILASLAKVVIPAVIVIAVKTVYDKAK